MVGFDLSKNTIKLEHVSLVLLTQEYILQLLEKKKHPETD